MPSSPVARVIVKSIVVLQEVVAIYFPSAPY